MVNPGMGIGLGDYEQPRRLGVLIQHGGRRDIAIGIEAGPFLFYFVTGLYFAAIYLTRGFGLVVATHTLYDVLVFAKGMIDVG